MKTRNSARAFGIWIASLGALCGLASTPAMSDILASGDTNVPSSVVDVDNVVDDIVFIGGLPGVATGLVEVNGGTSLSGNWFRLGEEADTDGVLIIDGADVVARGFTIMSGVHLGIDVGTRGTGYLVIRNGGTLTAGAVSRPNSSSIAAATGSSGAVTVDGVDSQFTVLGALNVGQGSPFGVPGASASGALHVLSFGLANIPFLRVGWETNASGQVLIGKDGTIVSSIVNIAHEPGSTGAMTVAGANAVLDVQGPEAFLTIGRNGDGRLSVKNGDKIFIRPSADSGFNIARNPESTGTVTVADVGSEIRVQGAVVFTTVGRRGTGSLTVMTGGNVVIEDPVNGELFVAPANRSVGVVRVLGETKDQDGNSTGTIPTALNTGGFLGLGVDFDRVSSAGVATLIIDSGGTVTAGTVEIGPNGTVFTNGTITGTVNNSGVINPGFSPGVATFIGTLVIKPGGILNIEVFGSTDGEFDVVNATSIVFEEGSELNLIIHESVEGTVPVLEADQIDGTATVTTTIVDDSGDTVSETQEETTVGDGSSAVTISVAAGGEVSLGSTKIDIKPDDPENKINSKSMAVIPVTMLAGILPEDVASAKFGPTGAEASAIGLAQSDVDGDGDEDLIARFRQKDTTLSTSDDEACLTLHLTNGQTLTGCDSVIVK